MALLLAGAAFTWQHMLVVPATVAQEDSRTEPVSGSLSGSPGGKTIWQVYLDALQEMKSGNSETAATMFREVLADQPSHVKSMVNLARTLIALNQLDEAEAIIADAISADSANAAAFRVRGRVKHAAGNDEDAIVDYQTSIALVQHNPYAHNNLGLIHILSGRYDAAVVALETAIEQKDDVPFFHNNLGMAYEGQGDFAKARMAFEQAVALKPDYAKAIANLERISRHLKEPVTVDASEEDLGLLPSGSDDDTGGALPGTQKVRAGVDRGVTEHGAGQEGSRMTANRGLRQVTSTSVAQRVVESNESAGTGMLPKVMILIGTLAVLTIAVAFLNRRNDPAIH
jgi:tetratricopeptide (TPR) repeat protein